MTRIIAIVINLAIINSVYAQSLPSGVHNYSAPIVIPRQRATAVPPPWQATQLSQPAGRLEGTDQFATVLRFAPTIAGQLIKTEGFGSGKVGRWWNNNSGVGDISLKSVLCASADGFTVDGQAGLGNHPYAKTGEHGKDFKWRADGLCSQGTGFTGEHLRFFQIPGTAVVLKSGSGKQAGAMGIYDYQTTRLDHITVLNSIAGIDCQVADARLSRIAIAGVVSDGLTVSGPGTYVDDCHIWGADRAAVFQSGVHASNCYFEAARIGTHILWKSDYSEIDGLNIGPATCWERGVLVESDNIDIRSLTGTVRSGTIGVELRGAIGNDQISGRLSFQGNAIGVQLTGHNNRVDLTCSTQGAGTTFIKVVKTGAASPTQLDVCIRGYLGAGVALDLSESGLDKANGQGNHFDIKCNGGGTPIIFPGGGTKYNLAPGTLVWLNGVLQK